MEECLSPSLREYLDGLLDILINAHAGVVDGVLVAWGYRLHECPDAQGRITIVVETGGPCAATHTRDLGESGYAATGAVGTADRRSAEASQFAEKRQQSCRNLTSSDLPGTIADACPERHAQGFPSAARLMDRTSDTDR